MEIKFSDTIRLPLQGREAAAELLLFLIRKAKTNASKLGKGVLRDDKYLEAGFHFPLGVGTQGVSPGIREERVIYFLRISPHTYLFFSSFLLATDF